MAGDLLGISVTGLRASQSALSTTGHNISNANVDGYSRQRVIAETNPATRADGGYVGNGVNVASIERIVNSFVTTQLRTDSTLYSDLNAYHDLVSQLDNLLSDENTGLSGALGTFFAAVQNGADEPSSVPVRQLVISESENLASRFNTIHSRFAAIEESVEEGLQVAVAEANALAKNIADINRKVAEAFGSGDKPNDLLDQRDETILKLSKIISIQTFTQGNGEVNVLIGNGQNLVVGDTARTLGLVDSEEDASKKDLTFTTGGSVQVLTNIVSGGEIGGLLRFRDTAMTDTYNEFGRIAVTLADTFNKIHTQAITLDNEYGEDFFKSVNEPITAANRVIGDSNNSVATNRQMYLNIVDSTELEASAYEIEFQAGGRYTITRSSDNASVTSGILPGNYPTSIAFRGLELEIQSGTFTAGDSFLLEGVKNGARDFSSNIADPRDLAFGSPIVTDTSLGNSGSGIISPGEVLSLTDSNGELLPLLANAGEMSPPLLIRFNTPTNYDVLDNSDPGNPVQLDPPLRDQNFVVGRSNPVFPTDSGERLVNSGGAVIGIEEGRSAVVGTGGVLNNNYPSEVFTFTLPSQTQAGAAATQTIYTPPNASARELASLLSNVPGVSVNASNYIELSNFQVSYVEPLQLSLNGTDLLEYEFDPITSTNVLSASVPDPAVNPDEFNNYIASRINSDASFAQNGIYAVSATDELTGYSEVRIFATEGDNLQMDLIAAANESLDVGDGTNSNVRLTGAGAGVTSSIVSGGKFDIAMADGVSLTTFPPQSRLLGDTTAEDFAKNRYMGIQVNLSGKPQAGDSFTLDFNIDGAMDNRSALALVAIQSSNLVQGKSASLSESYGSLIERVGIDTSSSRINMEASKQVLEHTTAMRNSISAVNLDEEAANLIRFEQMYSANAQVISVARNLFDTLINSF
ncbi:flagellar hook-associated protein FlgK [Saccharophagus degradans]|uniref:flagellar hook-associated protein FlgK n=1 Tax=Saccharophagus degradans TaxID=86304 RepID=UPI002478035F|nr:flagellar hook-associated protein FlgK [Saccharophagus degradans]WGP00301.1 flagellar hook-associated protein FlgK [Saccharophagus degradans]